jgi:hypothetical protein
MGVTLTLAERLSRLIYRSSEFLVWRPCCKATGPQKQLHSQITKTHEHGPWAIRPRDLGAASTAAVPLY